MIMRPIPHSRLVEFLDFFTSIIGEMGMDERVNAEDALFNLNRGYTGQYMGVYVDDFENPKHCLILAHFPGIVTRGNLTAVVLIYSHPDHRTKEASDVMLKTAQNYAEIHGTSCILGSAWKFRGFQPEIDDLWKSHGYEIQETTYVKLLE